eukprot:7851972-Heterocapsa_arctica.AAC.1
MSLTSRSMMTIKSNVFGQLVITSSMFDRVERVVRGALGWFRAYRMQDRATTFSPIVDVNPVRARCACSVDVELRAFLLIHIAPTPPS